MKTQIIFIAGDKTMDHMMHAADVFEPFKVFATIQAYELTLKPGVSVAEAISRVCKATEQQFRIVAAFVPGNPEGAFLDKTVKAISDGQKWCLLEPILKHYAFTDKLPEPAYDI